MIFFCIFSLSCTHVHFCIYGIILYEFLQVSWEEACGSFILVSLTKHYLYFLLIAYAYKIIGLKLKTDPVDGKVKMLDWEQLIISMMEEVEDCRMFRCRPWVCGAKALSKLVKLWMWAEGERLDLKYKSERKKKCQSNKTTKRTYRTNFYMLRNATT